MDNKEQQEREGGSRPTVPPSETQIGCFTDFFEKHVSHRGGSICYKILNATADFLRMPNGAAHFLQRAAGRNQPRVWG